MNTVEGFGGVVDLTLEVVHGGGRLGLDNRFETLITHEESGWQGSVFTMFAHSGTHVDAPVHSIKDNPMSIDQVPLDQLMGQGWLFNLTDRGAGEPIDVEHLEAANPGLRSGDIAVLRTDWTDRHWGEELPEGVSAYLSSPYLTLNGAKWLLQRGVKAIVYDFCEEYVVRNPGFRGEDCEVHLLIQGSGVRNIEYVTNLGALKGPKVTIIALPIKLKGLDGGPARVIALQDGV